VENRGKAATAVKAFVIHNPAAGQRDKTEELGQMVEYLTQTGWKVAGVEQTHGRGDATTYARRAVASGCDVLFAAGGDGTMSQTVDGLVGTNTALGVLPCGTGNVMALQLGLPWPGSLRPHSLTDYAQSLVEGRVRQVDVGRISLAGGKLSYHFLCWTGVGFDAQVNLAVNEEPERKHRLGVMAFVVATLLTLRDYAGTAAMVRIDGRRVSRRLIMLVANNIQLYGVFMKMAPRAILDDGLLDIYCFKGRGTGRTLLHVLRLLFNWHLQSPEVDVYQARQVEIKTARPLPVHIDGEPIGYTPIVIDVLPRALKLLVPRGAPPTLFLHDNETSEPGAEPLRPMQQDGHGQVTVTTKGGLS
jgi:diacylglycerol kinase (ATP)